MLNRLAVTIAVAVMHLMPMTALAQQDEKEPLDARLENYPSKVTLDESGTALTWVLFLILTALCVGVMFKNPNRSHLD